MTSAAIVVNGAQLNIQCFASTTQRLHSLGLSGGGGVRNHFWIAAFIEYFLAITTFKKGTEFFINPSFFSFRFFLSEVGASAFFAFRANPKKSAGERRKMSAKNARVSSAKEKKR
jgi:hypothetical protein